MDLSEINGAETGEGRDPQGRFAPGNPGGPGRPPRELSITQALRDRAAEATATGDKANVEALADSVWSMALDSKLSARDRLAAIAFVTDRLEGKARATVALEHEDKRSEAEQVADMLEKAANITGRTELKERARRLRGQQAIKLADVSTDSAIRSPA